MRDWTKSQAAPRELGDRALLAKLLEHLPEVLPKRAIFVSMLDDMVNGRRGHLTPRQRQWAEEELDAFEPRAENLASSGAVPKGKDVEMAPVLRAKLPLKPPGRT